MHNKTPAIDRERPSFAYQFFMLFMCLYAIAALGLQTLGDVSRETGLILDYVDWVVCGIFLFDFVRSLYLAKNRFRYLYTWGWIDLLSSLPMVDALRVGRVARLFRIVRVLRALRATRTLVSWVLRHKATSAFYSVLVVTFAMVVCSAIAVAGFERGADGANIQTAEDALWWAISTITTVGYGDRFPTTTEGRGIATMLMFVSLGLVGTLSGVVAAWFLGPSEREHAAAVTTEANLTAVHVRELESAVRELKATLAEVRAQSARSAS